MLLSCSFVLSALEKQQVPIVGTSKRHVRLCPFPKKNHLARCPGSKVGPHAPGIMVWMRLRKTKSAFISEAVQSGYSTGEAEWWWEHMYTEARRFVNGTAEGSDAGNDSEDAEDAIWVAQQAMGWWCGPAKIAQSSGTVLGSSTETAHVFGSAGSRAFAPPGPSRQDHRTFWSSREESVSSALTQLLRHKAKKQGYQLDTLGGVRVADILRWHGNIQGFQVTQEDIASAVAEEYISSQYRKRQLSMYADEEGHLHVRAYQGHS
jgi:hypothetical protein